MRGRRTIAAALAAVALCASPVGSSRAAPPASEPAFLAELEKANRLLAAGNAAEGTRVVKEALRVHEAQDYVRAKRTDLEDLSRRLAFRAANPPPDPAAVVQGSLTKYVPKTGEMKLQFLTGKPHELETTENDGLRFPGRFTGPFNVTVRGDRYPSTIEVVPKVTVGNEDDPKTRRLQSWLVVPGIAPYDDGSETNASLPCRLVHNDGDGKIVLAEKETSFAKGGEPWRVEVKVGRTRITATYNSKPIGSGPKPDAVFGYAHFPVADWTEIVLEGPVDPSWIQSKIDAAVGKKRTEFDAAFRPQEHLPSWLYAEAAVDGEGEGEGMDD